MSVMINLAPEAHQATVKAHQRSQMAGTIATLVAFVSVGVIALAFLVVQGQNFAISSLNSSIKSIQQELYSPAYGSQFSDLVDAVTVQQAIANIATIKQSNPKLSQFFTVLQQFSPQALSVSSVALDSENSLSVSGTASSYYMAGELAKALTGASAAGTTTSYFTGSQFVQAISNGSSSQPYFSNVALSGLSEGSPGQVTFSLTAVMSSEVTNASN